jgi:alpha-glucosidase
MIRGLETPLGIPGRSWLSSSVIYEVYLRSFADGNGDGIGDLRGVQEKLPYLRDKLGVDTLWLTPFYPSPLVDFGYDISDFTAVDPTYGTLEDFDSLVKDAHARDLRIIVDFVPNHTSDQHPWFKESRASRDSAKRSWYVWADPIGGGGPPSNWTSEMGGSAWAYDPTTGQYYLHSHYPEQPDLDWRSEGLRSAMLNVLRFWLDRDVDGIRIDVAHLLAKHPRFADNPVRSRPVRNMNDRQHEDFDLQEHINDRMQPEVYRYLAMVRRVLDEYSERTGRQRVAIAEIQVLPWERWSRFFGQADDGVHLPFSFALIESEWAPRALAATIEAQEAATPRWAWPNYVLQNHDRPRLADRVGARHIRNAAMLLLTLRGTPTLYYGEELGLADLPLNPDVWLDPLGRDQSRVPMPWTAGPGGGFSGGRPTASWLPSYGDLALISVDSQLARADSVLQLYRGLISLRRSLPGLRDGDYHTLIADDRLLAYARDSTGHHVVVALNFAASVTTVKLPSGGRVAMDTSCRSGHLVEDKLDLPACGGVVVELE